MNWMCKECGHERDRDMVDVTTLATPPAERPVLIPGRWTECARCGSREEPARWPADLEK